LVRFYSALAAKDGLTTWSKGTCHWEIWYFKA